MVEAAITAIIDQDSSLVLPREALNAIGVDVGAEVAIEIVGNALVVRSKAEAQRSREFLNVFESILTKRRTAYQDLSKGPDR